VAKRNVELRTLRQYSFGRAPANAVVLGFAAVEPKELRRGVEELAGIL
jgi:DNA-binding transcriptional MocR family regulator